MDSLLAYGAGAEQAFAAAAARRRRARGGPRGRRARRPGAGRRGGGPRPPPRRARETVAGATRRERQHVEALSALVAGETARGLALVDEHVAEFPRDALLVNQASSAIGFAGRPDREEHRDGVPRAPGPRLRRRLVVPVRAGLHLSRGGPLRGVAAPVGALARSSTRATPTPATTSPTSTSRRSTPTPAPRSWPSGWRATTGARRSTAISPGTWRCSSCTAAATRGRWRSSSATSCAAVNPRLAMIDGAALLWRFRLDGQPTAAAGLAVARRSRRARLPARLRLRRDPRRARLRRLRRRDGARRS